MHMNKDKENDIIINNTLKFKKTELLRRIRMR